MKLTRNVLMSRRLSTRLFLIALILAIGGFISYDGHGQPTLTGDGVVVMSVSPDLYSNRGGLWTSRLDGSDQRELIPVPKRAVRGDYDVALSPDGSRVAFVRSGSSGNALFVVAVTGGPIHRLVGASTLGSRIERPIWSPDGTRIAFAAGNCTFSRAALYTIGADGTALTRIVSASASRRPGSFDGRPLGVVTRRHAGALRTG